MPIISSPLELLKKLGLASPTISPEISPEQRQIYDESIRQQQSNDPTWKKVVRGGIDVGANIPKGLLGINPAQDESSAGYVANTLTQLGGTVDSPARAISIFKTMREREAATEAFKQAAKSMSPNIGEGAQWFAAKYPRVSAHMDLNTFPSRDTSYSAYSYPSWHGEIPNIPREVGFTQRGIEEANRDVGTARNLIAHEGMHVAQDLNKPQGVFNDLYNEMAKDTMYHKIPYEVTAFNKGRAARKGLYKIPSHEERVVR